jgi:hypothetical protein
MFDSRHAPRYLRWFDRFALLTGGGTLLVLMLLLAPRSETKEKKTDAYSKHSRAEVDLHAASFLHADELNH